MIRNNFLGGLLHNNSLRTLLTLTFKQNAFIQTAMSGAPIEIRFILKSSAVKIKILNDPLMVLLCGVRGA